MQHKRCSSVPSSPPTGSKEIQASRFGEAKKCASKRVIKRAGCEKRRVVDSQQLIGAGVPGGNASPQENLARARLTGDTYLRLAVAGDRGHAIIDGVIFERRGQRQFGRIARVAAGQDRDGYRVVVHGKRAYRERQQDRKSTRLNSSHITISYAVFCLKKKKKKQPDKRLSIRRS